MENIKVERQSKIKMERMKFLKSKFFVIFVLILGLVLTSCGEKENEVEKPVEDTNVASSNSDGGSTEIIPSYVNENNNSEEKVEEVEEESDGNFIKGRTIDGVLEERFNDEIEIKKYVVFPHIDYERILVDENNTHGDDPLYEYTTPDGKFNWEKGETLTYSGEKNVLYHLDGLTLDGNPIYLPTNFKGLSEEFANFDKIDLTNLTAENLPLVFKDLEKGYEICFDELPYEDDFSYPVDITKDGVLQLSLWVKYDEDAGFEVANVSTDVRSAFDLRVDGIGVGNTFNEMYEVLGDPSDKAGIAANIENELQYQIALFYRTSDHDDFSIKLYNSSNIYNPFSEEIGAVYSNVITGVSVFRP